jgi:hypothetical protein
VATPLAAADLLTLPVACAIGSECVIAQYFDADPSPEARDYTCGFMTYEGHTGVDFAVADYAAADAGVAVVAAAPGEVVAVRDGEADRRGAVNPEAVHSRECGNGVVIRHTQGLVTNYCHMRRGSILVQPDDRVERGTPLGLVGQSGLSEFPHLHFEARFDGEPIDPFSGRPADGCGNAGVARWLPETASALPYFAGFPYHLGFAPAVPDTGLMRAGTYDDAVMPAEAPEIVFWAELWGLVTGDILEMRLIGPDGTVLAESREVMDRVWARRMRYVRHTVEGPWPPGVYTGEVTYRRVNDDHVWTESRSVTIPAG